jgi:hypothetical protein
MKPFKKNKHKRKKHLKSKVKERNVHKSVYLSYYRMTTTFTNTINNLLIRQHCAKCGAPINWNFSLNFYILSLKHHLIIDAQELNEISTISK